MTVAIIIVALLALALAAAYISSAKKSSALAQEAAALRERLAASMRDVERLSAELERARQLTDADAKARSDGFELIARRLIEHQVASLGETQNRQLTALLEPLKNDIAGFRKKVEDCYSEEARQRFSLDSRIRELIEANNAIGRQAEELSTALRGNSKVQGDWGEMVLTTILEKSGLREGEEYVVQATTDNAGRTLRDESGRHLRPDVVVRYPGRGYIVIDSKVSLSAFTDFVNADSETDRNSALRRHLESVMSHIRELADKSYQDYVDPTDGSAAAALDFVMMFIPNEGAYAAALQADPALWQKAYDKRVLLVSPTQLVGALRLVSQLWSQNRQTRNALDIAKAGSDLYDKFAGFVDDLARVEKALGSTTAALDDAIKKLHTGKGNLISRVEKLRQLGVITKKQLPGTATDNHS